MITDQTMVNRYTVTSVRRYNITFPMYEPTDVTVWLSDDDGATETVLTLGTHYTVHVGASNYVTLAAGVGSNGDLLALVSSVPYSQDLDLTAVSKIDVQALETQLDRTTQQLKQVKDRLDNAVLAPNTMSGGGTIYAEEIFEARDDALAAARSAASDASDVATDKASVNSTVASFAQTASQAVTRVNKAATTGVNTLETYTNSKKSDLDTYEGEKEAEFQAYFEETIETSEYAQQCAASATAAAGSATSASASATSAAASAEEAEEHANVVMQAEVVRITSESSEGGKVIPEDSEVVHITGTETISGTKKFSAGLLGAAAAVASTAIDPTAGTVFTKTISANTTFTFGTTSGTGDAACITLILTNGGAYTVAWPNNLKWSGGEAPDLTASGVDVLTFITADSGTTWYGFLNGAGMA